MEQESLKELQWSVCRVFNKQAYYSIRRHINPNAERRVFAELKSSDIHQNFWDVCWPHHFKSDNDFTVLKVDEIKVSPTTQGRNIPGLVLETKVLKTEDTRTMEASIRKRKLQATGSLAGLLGNTLKIADILVICKNHLVPRANFEANSFQWSKVRQRTVILNFTRRPHTMIFVYRHDGQFNYRSWTREIQNGIIDQNWNLRVNRTAGVQHGACVLIQPEEEFKRTQMSISQIPSSNLLELQENTSNRENMAPNWQDDLLNIQENLDAFFPDFIDDGLNFFQRSPGAKTPSPANKAKNRESPASKENRSPQPGPSSSKRMDRANSDELNDGPETRSKRLRDNEKRVTFEDTGTRDPDPHSGPEDDVFQVSKRVCTEWSTQTVEFGTQD